MTPEDREIEQRFQTYHFSAAQAMLDYNKIPTDLTMPEIDALVLEVRTELFGASIEVVGQRVVELNNAFLLLQKQAKLIKQKHIVALDIYSEEVERLSPSEIKVLKTKKKVDDDLDSVEMMFKEMMEKKSE